MSDHDLSEDDLSEDHYYEGPRSPADEAVGLLADIQQELQWSRWTLSAAQRDIALGALVLIGLAILSLAQVGLLAAILYRLYHP